MSGDSYKRFLKPIRMNRVGEAKILRTQYGMLGHFSHSYSHLGNNLSWIVLQFPYRKRGTSWRNKPTAWKISFYQNGYFVARDTRIRPTRKSAWRQSRSLRWLALALDEVAVGYNRVGKRTGSMSWQEGSERGGADRLACKGNGLKIYRKDCTLKVRTVCNATRSKVTRASRLDLLDLQYINMYKGRPQDFWGLEPPRQTLR